MKERITDEKTGISYTLQGNYYLPDLALTDGEEKSIGLWGQRAEEIFFRLVNQMAEREGVTEQLKAENPMKWVGLMNNIRSRATEIVNDHLIYG